MNPINLNDPNQPKSGQLKNPSFRNVPMTGVIYVMSEAVKKGYSADASDWVNFGQGQPEASEMSGAPERVNTFQINDVSHEYSPVAGIKALRSKVADFYNTKYRQGKNSKYTYENVCIAPGGRAGLTRIAAALGTINLGHFLPDYTAYEELLGLFRSFIPIPILLDPAKNYEFTGEDLEREITGRGLGGILLSNPCNPTGKLIHGDLMKDWVSICKDLDCSMIVDEFYSHYSYTSESMVSAASAVEDVNQDPVAILDGITKNWRYPGWRVAWIVGPKDLIKSVASTGSFLDGGASHPMQIATLPLLDPEIYEKETSAIQASFRNKRTLMLKGLKEIGLDCAFEPQGTFYCWVDLANLKPELQKGIDFFRACLKEKLIVVPGEFFDIDPGGRRARRSSRFEKYVRLSFGPSEEKVKLGLQKLANVLKR